MTADARRLATAGWDHTARVWEAGDLRTPDGRRAIENFFETSMASERRGAFRILEAPGHSFSDLAQKVVSIINLDTVEDFFGVLGQEVHPLRFRANLYLAGLPAWSEFDLMGKTPERNFPGHVVPRLVRIARLVASGVTLATLAEARG